MKHITLGAALLLSGAVLAQSTVTVVTGASNADQVWYRLSDDHVTTAPLAAWDLAFEAVGFSGAIHVNTARGLKIYDTGFSTQEWDDLNSADVSNWTELNNSETDWNVGALSHGADGNFNLGWGNYNIVTHVITGTKVFAIDLGGSVGLRKLRINALSGGIYSFTFANLDGTGEVTEEIRKSDYSTKNFGYFTFSNNSELDREPASTEWDMLFTKYLSDLSVMWYGVAGVLQNKGVQVAQFDGAEYLSLNAWSSELEYSNEINVIGSDWKSFNGSAYVYPANRAYYVRARDGAVWRLVFTEYGGGATGSMTFTKELLSAVGLEEANTNGQVVVYPNPVSGGNINILADIPGNVARMRILDLNGRVVSERLLSGLNGFTARTVPVEGLVSGAYVLQLVHDRGVATSKVIVE